MWDFYTLQKVNDDAVAAHHVRCERLQALLKEPDIERLRVSQRVAFDVPDPEVPGRLRRFVLTRVN